MKTPLTSVIGYLQLAKKCCCDKETMANLSIALERAEYCNKLMNDFFELSVIDTDEYSVHMEQIDVSSLLCEQILANYPNFEQKGITPVFGQADQKIYALADRQMLVRVVQNPISNSIKYSNDEVSFAINVKDDIMIAVSNPVSEKIDTEQIFGKFYRSEQSRGGEGMGLGLYICDKFIHRMGGTILAECRWQVRYYHYIAKIEVVMENLKLKRELRMLVLAVLAGMAIGIGGVLYLSVENKVVGALMFTVGLYAICIHGLNLFTGKVGYLVNEPVSYLITLLVIWVGNLCGTYLAAFAVQQTRIKGLSETAKAMCKIKMEDGLSSLFVLAIFCGFLMFIAVEGYRVVKNPVILFMGVASFILCGFEHCIADMFYFSVAGMWSVNAFLRVIIITLGNSLGGILIPLVKKVFASADTSKK